MPPRDEHHREDCALYLGYAEVALRAGDYAKAHDSFQVALQFEARSLDAMTGLRPRPDPPRPARRPRAPRS